MVEYIQAKSILSKLRDAPDPYFGVTWSMNLYRGCQHGCIYCDTRSNVYNVGDISHIRIKKNALQLLKKELAAKRSKGTIGTGSMNDPYMPVVHKTGLTREALKLIRQYRFPLHIITKSNLVCDDADIISEVHKTYAAVSFTITAYNDTLAQKIEPGAPVTSERIKALKTLSNMGLYCGVVLTPVLPFITDSAENITKIIDLVFDAGARYILCWMGMTQREGQREYYYKMLDRHFPGVKSRYIKTYGQSYNCSSINAAELYDVFNKKCSQLGISRKMNFYQYEKDSQLKLFEENDKNENI
jgi:DNA repair photolyase